MKKQTYLLMLIGLFTLSPIVQLQAQFKPRFILEKDKEIYSLIGYSLGSYVLSATFNNTHYETYLEGDFYAKQKIKAPGKPEVMRILSDKEVKMLPRLMSIGGGQYRNRSKGKKTDIVEMSGWRMKPNGQMIKVEKKDDQVQFLDFKVTHIKRIPFSRRDFRALEKLQSNWQKIRKLKNNTYTFVLRRDSIFSKENKAYGLRKVVKVKNGKIVEVKAFKVVQNWFGRHKNNKVYENQAIVLSDKELKDTPTLDQFFETSLAFIKQERRASFRKIDKSLAFEINHYITNGYIKAYVLEKVETN